MALVGLVIRYRRYIARKAGQGGLPFIEVKDVLFPWVMGTFACFLPLALLPDGSVRTVSLCLVGGLGLAGMLAVGIDFMRANIQATREAERCGDDF